MNLHAPLLYLFLLYFGQNTGSIVGANHRKGLSYINSPEKEFLPKGVFEKSND